MYDIFLKYNVVRIVYTIYLFISKFPISKGLSQKVKSQHQVCSTRFASLIPQLLEGLTHSAMALFPIGY